MIGGKAIIVVGGTGMGKTTFVKNCLSQVSRESIFIYDVNAEYTDLHSIPFMKFSQFCEQAQSLKRRVIVFEESSIFLNNRGCNEKLIDILVRKRHTENMIFLVFHSLRSIPKYLFDYCNILVLHKTNDAPEQAEKFDRKEIAEAYNFLRNADMITNNEGRKFSPVKIIEILN